MYQLPFDQFQRYRLVSEVVPILEGDGPRLTTLEVGGYPARLPAFLPAHQITIVDQQKGEGDYIQADGQALPFPDRSFGLALSLDALEHVPAAGRDRFIAELCRVANSGVIIAAPFAGEAVKSADRAVFEFIRSYAGYEHVYLKEHLELELPDLVAILVRMIDLGLDVQVLPSGRLDRWMLMMAAYYTLDADPDLKPALPFFMEAYNRAFYDFDKAEPAYRHFLVGTYAGLGKRWGQLAALASGEAAEFADSRGLSLVIEFARTLALKQKDKAREALVAELVAKDEEIQALRDQVIALSDFAKKVKALPLYSFYKKFLKNK